MPEQPTVATLIADESAPAAVAPYSYDDYSLPYYAYGVPVGIGFRSFHQPGFHHAGFRSGGFTAVSLGVISTVVFVAALVTAAVVVTGGIADALIGLP